MALFVKNPGHDLPKGTGEFGELRAVNRQHQLLVLDLAIRCQLAEANSELAGR
jgi:hypothetical protein